MPEASLKPSAVPWSLLPHGGVRESMGLILGARIGSQARDPITYKFRLDLPQFSGKPKQQVMDPHSYIPKRPPNARLGICV